MKAIVLKAFGGVDQLHLTRLVKPAIKKEEVLVRVKALSINPVDVQTRAGGGIAGWKFKDADPIILGWDLAGTVEESASDIWQPGDKIFGMVHFPGQGKTYAEYVAAPANQLARIPPGISFETAAATTLAALTAWQALHRHGTLKKGDKILIHAASGGVGHFATQIAKAAGAYVIGTSSAQNRDFVLGLGADEFVDYQDENFEDKYHDLDFILDTAGHDYVRRSIPVLRKGGTLISIPGSISVANQQKAEAAGVTAANILVHSNGVDLEHLAALLHSGKLKPHIANEFPFKEMAAAHLQLESHQTIGKVVLNRLEE
jgi:NADPH:quinone reductase-like Zn-dependent oxidoreductase